MIKRIWNDPVGSKVISVGICALLSSLWAWSKSSLENITLIQYYQNIINTFPFSPFWSHFCFWSIFIISVIFFYYLIILVVFLYNKISLCTSRKRQLADIPQRISAEKEVLKSSTMHSTSLFAYRIAQAFPGQRGIHWYDAKNAVKRLSVFFGEQFVFEEGSLEFMSDPFWWFRGSQAMAIRKFKVLSKTKVLIGWDELEIDKIAVNYDDAYYKCFIYIEAKAEKPTKLYDTSKEYIQRRIAQYGYATEEYGINGDGRLLTRQEFDDGASVLKGTVCKNENAEFRIRYLSPYNMLICAKQAPYNSQKFNIETSEMFNNILNGTMTINDLFQYLSSYPKPLY